MKRADVISRLQSHEADLRRLGVQRPFLFGSTARDEAVDDSDVDLFFDHERGQLGLYEVMDVADRATRILGSKADVMTRTAYIPARETISRNLP